MQAREYDLDRRYLFFRMQTNGNAAPIVLDADAAVGVERDRDVLAVAAQGFVGSVVDDFLNDMQRIFSTRIHPRPLLDRLKSLEDADGRFAVIGGGGFLGCHSNQEG